MTTKEAFEDLISQRNWHKDLGIGENAAYALAKRARDGEKISTDKMEEVLEKAGYVVVTEKIWINKNAQ